MDPTIARIWELAAPLAKMEGMEIIDIELRHEGSRGGRVLRLYLDKEGGPNMDDLSRVSRELSDILDVREIVEGAYTLEVSSPGLDRKLVKESDYSRFDGKLARIRTRIPLNQQKVFRGRLQGLNEGKVRLELPNGSLLEIPFDVIQEARLEFDWAAETKKK